MSNSAEAEVVAELRGASDGWSGDAACVSAEVAERAAAFLESQRATIERVEGKRDEQAQHVVNAMIYAARSDDAIAAAEARVTALEAEMAGAIKLADGYGIVLMMIAAGCSDPQRFAKRMLAEYEAEAKKMEAKK